MGKALRVAAILAAFGLTAWIGVVALAQGSSPPTPAPTTISTTSPAPGNEGDDVEGNCDEAEHTNDQECLGVIQVADDESKNDDQGEDVNDDDQGEDVNDDDQGEDVNDDDQGEQGGDSQGEEQGDDSGSGSDD